MASKHIRTYSSRTLVALLAATALFASQHSGAVKAGGLPIPGATVTATQGDKKLVTTTDENGAYVFPDLADGIWSMQVEMVGFGKASKEIGVASDAPNPTWELKLQTPEEFTAALGSGPAMKTPETIQVRTEIAAPTVSLPVVQQAAPSVQAANQRGGNNQNAANGGRGQTQAGRGGANGNTPSLIEAFQQVGVSQTADLAAFSQEGAISAEQAVEFAPSANEALVLQGSQSSAMTIGGMPDFGAFGGRGGEFGGPGMMGMGGPEGGPGGFGGPGAMGGDMAGGAATDGGGAAMAGGMGGMGGGGGRGGMGGGPMMGGGGGRGGMGGGPMMGGGGGRGGMMAGGGGRGGAGGGRGAQGGPGGRGAFMNRPGAAAFGNNRRNPRMMYTGNLSINEANSLLNAQKLSISGANVGKPYMNRTSTSATIGGPFKIPKLLDGTRGQFTLSVSISRSRNGQAGQLTEMPTDLERIGDFSKSAASLKCDASATNCTPSPVVIYDPTNGAPFPNSVIPSQRISSIAQALVKYYPGPNIFIPNNIRNYQMSTTPLSNSASINARVNQTLNTKNRLNVGFGYQGSNSTTPNSLGFIDPNTGQRIIDTGNGRGQNESAGWSHNFTTRLINTLNFTFSRQRTLGSPYFANYPTNIEQVLGIQGVATDPLNYGPPNLSFTNYGGFSAGTASIRRDQTVSLTESLMWVKQKHSFQFGGAFRRMQYNNENNSNPRGSFGFNGTATSQFLNGKAVPGTGFDFADFLLGVPDTAMLQCGGASANNGSCNGSPSYYFRGSVWSAYVQDDWRIAPRFSVNIGVRWDYQTPINELRNQIVNMAFAPNFTAYTPVLPGQQDPFTGVIQPGALINPDRNNISPRFGMAWRPSAKHSTVIRGGYGTSYNSSAYSSMASRLSQQPPLAMALNTTILNNLAALQAGTLTMANALTPQLAVNTLTKNTYGIDPNYKIGYAQTWNLSVQQNLPHSFQSTFEYRGIKGTHLDRTIQPWVLAPGSTASPYPTGYTYETYGGNSIMNSASAQLMRRFSSGISASANYSFQKYIADSGSLLNWLDARADRAVQGGPHSLGIRASYSTGMGRFGGGLISGWKGKLMRDWTIAMNMSVSSGSPLTPSCRSNVCQAVGATNVYSRPNYTGATLAPAAAGYYFNPLAFAVIDQNTGQLVPAMTPGLWGNAGRSIIPGPMGYSLNGQASRVIRLGERRSADFQIQAQNVMNTVIISSYVTQIGSNTYGQATNSNNPRTVTASLRFRF